MVKSIEDLLIEACEIRDAENEKENTALRVGTMLVNLLETLGTYVGLDDLREILESYAQINSLGLTVWHQSRVVPLVSMGSDLDNVDGGDWTPTMSPGDIRYNPSGNRLELTTSSGTEIWTCRIGVIYVNMHSMRLYAWSNAGMTELSADHTQRRVIADMHCTDLNEQEVGTVGYYPSTKRLIYKYADRGWLRLQIDPDAVYIDRQGLRTVVWNPSGETWLDVGGNISVINNLKDGGENDALSAEMGKELKEMIDSIGSSTLGTGTFNEAWARSQIDNNVFSWLLNDEAEDVPIVKPIWHIGNGLFIDAVGAVVLIEASSAPASPTITINGIPATSGATIARNTQVVITPSSGSVLFYRQGSGAYNRSDKAVTLTMSAPGTQVISAYCSNPNGNSSTVTLNITVAGTAVPTFSQASGEVARGGSVAISVPTGGELHYKVDNGSWTTASGTSVNLPITSTDSEHPTVIQAYNVEDGDQSSTITREYYMAALTSPTFSVATGTEFPIGGGSVILGPTGATIYYTMTTDGTTPADPTDQSTLYSGAIAVSVATTIKAVAKDNYGYSEVKTASYTVVQPKIVVTATEATTMSLGETGLTALTINAGTNEFSPSDLGITSFADHVFPSLSFGDRTKIITFDGGGLQVNSLDDAFSALTAGGSNPTLTKCVGIVLAGQDAHASQVFLGCTYLTECELSGVVNGSMAKAFNTSTGRLTAIDISGLSGHITNCGSMFMGVGCEKIDVSQFTFTKDKAASMFRGCSRLTTIKVGKIDETGDSYVNLMFKSTNNVTTLICTEAEPYVTGWLAEIKNSGGTSSLTAIYVPDASVNDYKAHSEWGTYASIIHGISEYTE